MTMPTVRLGRTNLVVEKNGFGALPVQRVTLEEAGKLLRKAFDNGVNFFDTARAYTDSEEKIGAALSDVRDRFILATKTQAKNAEGFWKDLEQSLALLKTDHIDIYQFHNPGFVPRPGGEDGLYDAMLEARRQGKVRFIGITNHRLHVAREAVESGLYDTLQFPFSYLASDKDKELVALCKQHDVGFIAMKGLSGGLINNSAAAYAFMAQYDNVLPIWGVQREKELDEFIGYIANPAQMTPQLEAVIEKDRKELTGAFCRGCGYCLPCPAGIDIPLAARMSLMLRRAPVASYITPKIQENMKKIENCLHCNHCVDHCPYGLNTPELLKENYADFKTFL